MEMKYLFIHSPNTPRNKILIIIGSTISNGSIAFEDELALEDIIKPKDISRNDLYSICSY